MEKQKNQFNINTEIQIVTRIYQFLDSKTKTELVMMSKKEIAKSINISVPSLDKYFTKINQLSREQKS
jgi:DNA-binding CsgD family transcriptional regulator